MEKEKINDILNNLSEKSNKDIIQCRNELIQEFDSTKNLIVELTRHLDAVEINYNILNKEISKRLG